MSAVVMEPVVPRRGPLIWALTAAALTAAVALIPPVVANLLSASQLTLQNLSDQVSIGLDQWVLSGSATPSTALSDAASFWAVFHVTKAVLALGLLAALILLGTRIWANAANARARLRRALWTVTGILGAWTPFAAALVVIANIQGALAPLSSVLTFLPGATTPGIAQIRAELASGIHGPATNALIDDFRTYHAVFAVTLFIVITALIAVTVLLWICRARLPRTDTRLRIILAAGGITIPLLFPIFGLLLLANASTVADTAPALATFFDGSGL